MASQTRIEATAGDSALDKGMVRNRAGGVPRRISQGRPMLLPEMEEAAMDALRNDKFLRGENVVKFEEEFARFVGTDFAVSVSSGTNALQFIMVALDLSGKRTVTTPTSFIATANAVVQAGGTPVFADVDGSDFCLDPSMAEEALRGGAAGLLPVHIYGHPADMDAFGELSVRYGVPVVEDACQAHGAVYKGKRAGALGTAAAFSFYPSKNMTVLGDGGMVTTDDEKVAERVSKLRDGGRSSWYEHDVLGYTSRLSSVSAAIGRVQLRHLGEWNMRRRAVAAAYRRGLKDLPGVKLPPDGGGGREPVYHQFVIRTQDRGWLQERLGANGVETAIHYPIPIHLQPLYVRLFGYGPGAYPASEGLAKEVLSLPMHPLLSDEDVEYVCELIRRFSGGGA
ncbi:MAG: DegT/DnrJ/EryC1/StrS family aminotransferase [Thaumarchaeota archaeon]|nr:DegT/DnrJ/EryC1/StrS family aminotransferase [Nitrososphaerota archaeon]